MLSISKSNGTFIVLNLHLKKDSSCINYRKAKIHNHITGDIAVVFEVDTWYSQQCELSVKMVLHGLSFEFLKMGLHEQNCCDLLLFIQECCKCTGIYIG